MNKIEKLLREHNEEFTQMVNEFYDEKYPSKKSKTICRFKVGGKDYNSDIFTKNYREFLNDLTQTIGGNVFKKVLGNYVKFDPSEFSASIIQKNQYDNINDVFYVSTYTDTDKKLKHITDLCEYLDIPLQLEFPKYNTIRELEVIN
jgi:hypothetical protein